LRLIVGDDFATGKYMKTIFDKFEKIPFAAIPIPRNPLGDQCVEDDSTHDFVPHTTGESSSSNGTMRLPNP